MRQLPIRPNNYASARHLLDYHTQLKLAVTDLINREVDDIVYHYAIQDFIVARTDTLNSFIEDQDLEALHDYPEVTAEQLAIDVIIFNEEDFCFAQGELEDLIETMYHTEIDELNKLQNFGKNGEIPFDVT